MDTEKKIKKFLKVIDKIGIASEDPRVISIVEALREQDRQIVCFETPSKTWLVGDEVWWWEDIFKVPQWGTIKEFESDFATIIRGGQELTKVPVKDLGALIGNSSAKCGDVVFTIGDEVKFKQCQMPLGYKVVCLDFVPENKVKVLMVGGSLTPYVQWESLSSLQKV